MCVKKLIISQYSDWYSETEQVVKNLTLSFVRSPNELGILPESIVSYMSITWRFFIRLSSEGSDPDTRVPHSDMLLRFYRGGEGDGGGDGEGGGKKYNVKHCVSVYIDDTP